MSAVDLGAVVIREAVARAGVDPADTGDVIMGCVLQAGNGMNVARQAALKAGIPVDAPAETINRVCGSGLQAVVHATEAVKVGYTPMVIAGGTESMSTAPYLLKGARWGYRMGNAEVRRFDAGRGPDVRDRRLSHGDDGGGDRFALRRQSRGPGRVRGGEPAPCAGGDCGGPLPGRDRAGRDHGKEGRAAPFRDRRAPAGCGDDRVARRAAAGVQEGRDGDGWQRVGDQRRCLRARRRLRTLGAGEGQGADRAYCVLRLDGGGSGHHGHGAGACDPPGGRRARACSWRTSKQSS